MLQIVIQHVTKIENLRFISHDCQHIDAECGLHCRMLIQVIQYNTRINIASHLNHYTHTIAVGFITQIGNALNPLLAYKLCNLLNQSRLVDLIRQFMHDDPGFTIVLFNCRFGTHRNRSAASAIGLANTLSA
ncbi:hypothetical protein D3C80_1809710 [compost metagenome]